MTGRRRLLVRCDGGSAIGFGHVVRSLALAEECSTRGAHVVFAVRGDHQARVAVERKGYGALAVPERPFDYSTWFEQVVDETGADTVVIDARDGIPAEAFERLRRRKVLVVAIDDTTDQRRYVDLAFYPPLLEIDRWDWTGFTGRRYAGWEWVLLRREFRELRRASWNPTLRVLITAGGSDPGGFTAMTIRVLDEMNGDFEPIVLLGPALMHREIVERAIRTARRPIQVREATDQVHALMMQSDVAVASFGVTAFELAAAGVPAIHLCLTEEHVMGSRAFAAEDVAITLGVRTDNIEQRLRQALTDLLLDEARRDRMRTRGQSLVDGRGAERVADQILGASALAS